MFQVYFINYDNVEMQNTAVKVECQNQENRKICSSLTTKRQRVILLYKVIFLCKFATVYLLTQSKTKFRIYLELLKIDCKHC